MRYFGGKKQVSKEIAQTIKANSDTERKRITSPFVGGGWVESCLPTKNMVCSDKHPYLIEMYNALKGGWVPPTEISKEEYACIKRNKDGNPALSGFVGFGCSFAGKWFGGYAKDKQRFNYCLAAHKSILRKMETLKHAIFICRDYTEIKPVDAIVYCDPPYQNTTGYGSLVGRFDTKAFWDTVRVWSLNNDVYVSEYEAPEDFEAVWQREVRLSIRDGENKNQKRVEKLYRKR